MTDAIRQDRTPEANRIYEMIGRCVTKFCAIEDRLLSLLKTKTRPPSDAAVAFEKARTIYKRLKLVDRALAESDHLTEWKALRVRIEAAAKQRNNVAHSGAAVQLLIANNPVAGQPGKIEWGHVELYRRDGSGNTYYDGTTLEAVYQDLDALENDLWNFRSSMMPVFHFKLPPKSTGSNGP